MSDYPRETPRETVVRFTPDSDKEFEVESVISGTWASKPEETFFSVFKGFKTYNMEFPWFSVPKDKAHENNNNKNNKKKKKKKKEKKKKKKKNNNSRPYGRPTNPIP